MQGYSCDSLLDERAVAEAAPDVPAGAWLDPALLAGARLVVARLPKSLAALDELAGCGRGVRGPGRRAGGRAGSYGT